MRGKDDGSLLNRPSGSASLLAIAQVAAAVLSLASAPVIGRAVGADGRGLAATCIAYLTFAPVMLGVGLPLGVRRYSPTVDGIRALRTARELALLALIPAGVIGVVVYKVLLREVPVDARHICALGLALAPLTVIWALNVNFLVGRQRFVEVFVLRIAQPLVFILWVLGGWLLLRSIEVKDVVLGNVVSSVIGFAISVILVPARVRGPRLPSRVMLSESGKFAGGALVDALSAQIYQIVALPILGAFHAGLFSAASTVGSIPIALGQAVSGAYFPEVAKEGNSSGGRSQEAIRVGAVAGIIAAIGVIAVSPLVPVVFGPDFVGAVAPTAMYSVAGGLMTVGFVVSMNLVAVDRGPIIARAQVCSLAVGVSSFLILGRSFGIGGAVVGVSSGYLTSVLMLRYSTGCTLGQTIPRWSDFRLLAKILFRRASSSGGDSE